MELVKRSNMVPTLSQLWRLPKSDCKTFPSFLCSAENEGCMEGRVPSAPFCDWSTFLWVPSLIVKALLCRGLKPMLLTTSPCTYACASLTAVTGHA